MKTAYAHKSQVLVADDSTENSELIRCLLSNWGVSSYSATSGKQVLSKVTGENYQLVILDKMLPDMSWCQLVHDIKKLKKHIPIIRLSWGGAKHTCDQCCEFKNTMVRPQHFKEVVKEALKNPLKYDIIQI